MITMDIIIKDVRVVPGRSVEPKWQYETEIVTTINDKRYVNTPVKSKHHFKPHEAIRVKLSKKKYGGYHAITPVE